MKQESVQFPDCGVTEFPYYGTSTEKHMQFVGSMLPHRFRASGNHVIPNVWECANFNNIEIFCGKPCHFEAADFWGN